MPKEVCPEAKKRPFPQLTPARAMVGRALTTQREKSANTKIVELPCVGFVISLLNTAGAFASLCGMLLHGNRIRL